MATYEFECPKCGARAAVSRPMADYAKPVFCGGDAAVDADGREVLLPGKKHRTTEMTRLVSNFHARVVGGTR